VREAVAAAVAAGHEAVPFAAGEAKEAAEL
jgi:hypothetical protein